MGIKSWWQSLGNNTNQVKSNPYSDGNFFNLFTSGTYAGEKVDYNTSMRHQDVYTCVRIKSESIGQLPIKLYRHNGNSKTQINSGREHRIFTQRPNAYQTWQDFSEMYVTSMELLGNFYAEIKRNRYGNVYEIVPFKYQNNCSVEMDANGNVYYTYSTNDGRGKVTTKTYMPSDILHIHLNSFNGYSGISPITMNAMAIGSAIAGEKHSSSLFENGTRPSGILQTDEVFDEEDQEMINRIRDQWNDMYRGSQNAGKTAILEYGLKFQQIQMTAVDAQLIEQRKYSREQIASIFRVPSHMLNDPSGMKYNSIEHNNASFFRDSLMPLVTKLENAISPLLPANHSIKMDERTFVRGDRKTLVQTLRDEINMGTASINEARIELGREPVNGGDVFAVQTNNLTFGTWDNLASIQEQQRNQNNTPPENNPSGESDDDSDEES